MRKWGVWLAAVILVITLFPGPVSGSNPTELGSPSITIDESGIAYVFWVKATGSDTSLSLAKVARDGSVLKTVGGLSQPKLLPFGCVTDGNHSVFVAYQRYSPAEMIYLLRLDDDGNEVFDVPLGSGTGPTWIHRSETGSLYTHWWNSTVDSLHRLVKTDALGTILDGPRAFPSLANFSNIPVIEDDGGALAFLYRHGAVDDSDNVYFVEDSSLIKADRLGTEAFRQERIAGLDLLGPWENSVDIGPEEYVGISETTDLDNLRWVVADMNGNILHNSTVVTSDDLSTYGEFYDVHFRFDHDGKAHFVWTYVKSEPTEPGSGVYRYEYYIYHSSVDVTGNLLFVNLLARTWNLVEGSHDWVVVGGAVTLLLVSAAVVAFTLDRRRKSKQQNED